MIIAYQTFNIVYRMLSACWALTFFVSKSHEVIMKMKPVLNCKMKWYFLAALMKQLTH